MNLGPTREAGLLPGPRAVLLAALCLAACGGAPGPAALDTANDACAHCRMAVSDPHVAAQIVSPGEEPLFFDDIGCLRDYVRDHSTLPPGAVAFVADHRTAEWVPAARAVYTETGLHTPMASGLVAHRDTASRDGDPTAARGQPVPAADILGPLLAPRGR